MKSMKYLVAALLIIVSVGAGCTKSEEQDFNIASQDPKSEVNASGYFDKVQTVKGDKMLVRPSDIIASGQGKDGFDVITDPKFISVEEMMNADQLFGDISGISIKDGDTYKFYPHQILAWHVIVEDTVNNKDVIVTYSQLTEVSKVFLKNVNGVDAGFGVSGLLWNNNVLMYDKATETLWSQMLSRGVYGEHAGDNLFEVPYVIMTWDQWREAHPDGKVLSTDTGFERAYKRSPYGTYLTSHSVLFPLINNPVKALDPKAVIVGVRTKGGTKAFQEGPVVQFSNSVKNDVVGGVDVVVWHNLDGGMYAHLSEDVIFKEVTDHGILDSNGNEWLLNDNLELEFNGRMLGRADTLQTFWFMWSALYPDTQIYGHVAGKGLVDGEVFLDDGEGVELDDGNFHLDVNDPNFGINNIEIKK